MSIPFRHDWSVPYCKYMQMRALRKAFQLLEFNSRARCCAKLLESTRIGKLAPFGSVLISIKIYWILQPSLLFIYMHYGTILLYAIMRMEAGWECSYTIAFHNSSCRILAVQYKTFGWMKNYFSFVYIPVHKLAE